MPITFTPYGAAGTVTGSKHLIEITRDGARPLRMLLDCGMFQGEAMGGGGNKDRNRRFGFDPASIDVLVLSHAHIDHSGLVPRLVKEGFTGPIWSTPATRDLCAIMLTDSAHIQEYDAAFDMKRARKQGRDEEAEGPLYRVADVPPALALFRELDLDTPTEIAPGVELTFTEAGHILGSAAVQLRIVQGERTFRLAFTGDVGRYADRLLPHPAPFPQADAIICESTYGDREHEPLDQAEEALLGHVRQVCVEQQGRLIVPAFSVGRTQEVLYALNKLYNAGRLPRIPVFVDSPLAISATEISRRHAHLYRAQVRAELAHDPDLFSFPGVTFVREAERSKELNTRPGPCIIVSASGMMEAGRVRHHLFHALGDPRNGVLVVGHCTPGTLGGQLLAGATEVQIFRETIPVRASVRRMAFYSAHADRNELLRYLDCQDYHHPATVYLVHGDDPAREALRDLLLEKGCHEVVLPGFKRTYRL
ncbi:MAG: MBL fold metallo-hydrolase [Flavobacteriales bacterium]|jgi:metallo-beta-lactamase family protein|nr:MBL fold metallo-hydrolase [Flavobacteriales bacterium]